MVSAAAVESFEECVSVWKILTEGFPGVDLREMDGLAVRWAENPFAFWNALFLLEQGMGASELRSTLRRAREIMRSKQQPGFLVASEELLAGFAGDADGALAEEGFSYALSCRGMVGDVRLFPEAATPPQLTMRRVTDDTLLETYARLNCQAYGLPESIAATALTSVWKEGGFSYVAFVGDEAVSTAAAVPHEGSLYVGLVSTLPAHQRRGYGEATLRHAAMQASHATGLTRTTLHATDAGYPIYLRLGYSPVASIRFYQPAL